MLKNLFPWWLKMIIKIIIYRLPINYHQWSSINLFRHGNPDNQFLYLEKFTKHFNLSFPNKKPKHFVCLELGPGDSIATGIVANAFGAKKTYLLDVGDFVIKDIGYYKKFSEELTKNKIRTPDISEINSFEELLTKFNIIYLESGIESFQEISSSSVDMIFSHSVIEHIRLAELPTIVSELYRVASKKAIMSHNIDLMDHLDYSLNNLRFSKRLWESNFFAKSGFYTNRLRYSQIIKIFRKQGFNLTLQESGRWQSYPISLQKIHNEFNHLEKDDLLIRTMHIVANKLKQKD
jgi:hypothetical protein